MSDDKIAEIRAKLDRLTSHVSLVSAEMRRKSDRADEAWAEVEKLRVENERLRAELASEKSFIVLQRGDIEKLRAQVERQDREILDHCREIDWLRAQIALLVLEGKP